MFVMGSRTHLRDYLEGELGLGMLVFIRMKLQNYENIQCLIIDTK